VIGACHYGWQERRSSIAVEDQHLVRALIEGAMKTVKLGERRDRKMARRLSPKIVPAAAEWRPISANASQLERVPEDVALREFTSASSISVQWLFQAAEPASPVQIRAAPPKSQIAGPMPPA
jgi:hypothetical protein